MTEMIRWRVYSAMHAVLTSFTAALLLVHAAFGCCWHHAHCCAIHGNSVSNTQQGGCCEHHRHEGSTPAPCDCQLQCGVPCVYLLSQKVRVEAPQSVASLDLVATAPLLVDAQSVSAVRSDEGGCCHWPAPPLRLHLM